MAQRILFKDSGLGSSNNPLSGYKFVGYNGLTFSQLDSDGNIIPIAGSGSGSGLNTASNGLSVLGDSVQIGGFLNQTTTIDGNGQDLNIDGLLNFSVTASQTIQFRSIDGSGFDKYVQVSNSDVSIHSGSTFVGGSTYSTAIISDTSAYLYSQVASGDNSFISAEQGQVYLEIWKGLSSSWIRIPIVSESVSDGSTNNNMIIKDDISVKGLVYYDDYTSNFTTYSLVTKGYVDALSFASGVSGTGTTNYVPKWTGTNTLSSTSKIYDDGTNVGINNSSPFFQLDIDGSTRIRATESNYELQTVAVSGHFYVNHQQIVGGSKNTQLTLDCAGNSYDVGAKLSHYQDGSLEGFSSLYLTPTSTGGAIALISGASGSEFVSQTYSVFFMDSKAVSIGNNQLYWNSTGHTNAIFYVSTTSSNVGIGTSTPDSKAILDLSSTTKGFLPPRMTADQANAAFGTQSTAPEGMLIYITSTSSNPAINECFFDVGWYGRQDAPGPGYSGSSGGFNWVKLGYYSYG